MWVVGMWVLYLAWCHFNLVALFLASLLPLSYDLPCRLVEGCSSHVVEQRLVGGGGGGGVVGWWGGGGVVE